jgi:hypothetical protein
VKLSATLLVQPHTQPEKDSPSSDCIAQDATYVHSNLASPYFPLGQMGRIHDWQIRLPLANRKPLQNWIHQALLIPHGVGRPIISLLPTPHDTPIHMATVIDRSLDHSNEIGRLRSQPWFEAETIFQQTEELGVVWRRECCRKGGNVGSAGRVVAVAHVVELQWLSVESDEGVHDHAYAPDVGGFVDAESVDGLQCGPIHVESHLLFVALVY